MFFKVQAKCGHVGRNNYIVKQFFVRADSAKLAAKYIRRAPRVKHHHKDAIISVEKIDYEEYVQGVIKNQGDPYFNVYNTSDQKRVPIEDIIREEDVGEKMVRQVRYKLKKWKIIEDEAKKMVSGVCYG